MGHPVADAQPCTTLAYGGAPLGLWHQAGCQRLMYPCMSAQGSDSSRCFSILEVGVINAHPGIRGFSAKCIPVSI